MKKVLIVDDSLANLKLARHSLQHASFHVIEAVSGMDGIKKAKRHIPDLILMDIQMPGMDGIEAMEMIREMKELAHIPIIALTASAMQGDKEKLLEKGFNGYIAKPIVVKSFIEVVSDFCQS